MGHGPSGAERDPRLASACFLAMARCGSLGSVCAVLKCSKDCRARRTVEIINWALEGAGRLSSKSCSRQGGVGRMKKEMKNANEEFRN